MRQTASNRRQFLAGTAAAAALGLAGCSMGSSDTTTNSTSPGDGQTPDVNEDTLETTYKSRERYAHPGTSFDDFEDLSKWTALTGDVESNDTSFAGSQSAKLLGENGSNTLIERAADSRDFSDTELSMAVRTTTPSKIAVNVRLVDPFGNQMVRSLRRISQDGDDVAWFRTAPGTFSTSGDAFDITQIERVQVHMLNATTTDATISLDDMRTHPKPDKGYIVLSWDDSRRSYYEDGAPINDEFGFNVTMATAPRLVGGGNFMSVGQLKEREEAGDDICTHGSLATNYTEESGEEIRETMAQNKQWLRNQGFDGANAIVYPGNNYNATVLSEASKYHYIGGMNASGSVNTTGLYSFDPLVLPRTIGNDLSTAKEVVDNVAEFKECGILNFHDFSLNNTMTAGEYEQLLQHIDETGDAIEVITLDELWELRKQGENGSSPA